MISYLHLCCVCIAHRYSKCAILTWLNPYSWKSDCRLWVSSGPHISSFNNILSEYQAFSLNLLVSLVQCCSFSCNEAVLNPPLSLSLSSSSLCLLQTVQLRGAAVIKARKLSSAMSAAKAISDHMRDWWFGTLDVSRVFGRWGGMTSRICSKPTFFFFLQTP